jgi:hypothetical protein
MALVNKVEKKIKTTRESVIKYQILTYCFFNGVQISQSDLDCLTELALNKDIELTKFCDLITEKEIFKSAQSARNAVTKAAKKLLISKTGKNKKTIRLSEKMEIQEDGTIFLDFKILGNES